MAQRKRGNDHQLTKDSLHDEDEDDEQGGLGGFEKASEEELKTRRIIKVRRPASLTSSAPSASTSEPSNAPAAPNPFASFSFAAAPNPFANFSGLAPAPAPATQNNTSTSLFPSSASNNQPTKPSTTSTNPVNPPLSVPAFKFPTTFPPAPANPPPAPTTTTTQNNTFSTQNNNKPTQNNNLPAQNNTHSAATTSTSNTTTASSTETEEQKKVRKLNESIARWADRQAAKNLLCVWKEGVKDYIRYQQEIKQNATGSGAFGFSLGAGASGVGAATASGVGAEGEGDGEGDDEGEPILPPEKILDAKLAVFSAQDKEWKDLGKGIARLVEGAGGKKRVLVRNTMGRIEPAKNKLKFSCFVSAGEGGGGSELRTYLLKLKDAQEAEDFKKEMDRIVQAM
eukprot:gene29299-35371_t